MKVIRERPCQRRHHRVTAPLHVRLGENEICRSIDWSLGGVKLALSDVNDLGIGDECCLTIELPFQGFEIKFDVKAIVVRLDEPAGQLCCEFSSLDDRSRDLMKHFVEDLIRGKMATIDDTICRIDMPVTPISTQPDPSPANEVALHRWPLKTIVMSGFYGLLGLFVFGYLAILVYTQVTQFEVSSAVVSAPLQVMRMPVDGVVHLTGLGEGSHVRRGEPIARIEDLRLQARIDDADNKVSQSRDRLWRAEQKFEIESERIKLYQVINRVDRDMAAAQVGARTEALSAADGNLQRIQTLWDRGFATKVQLDDARQRQSQAAASLRESELLLEQATVMNSVSGRRHYNHKEFVTDLDLLLIEVDEFRSQYDVAVQQLQSLQGLRDHLVVRAPFDGRVVKMLQVGNAMVLRDEPLVVLEMDGPATVTAFLQQDEVLQIGLNDQARIYLPALGRYVQAEVVSIDRSSAFLDEKFSQFGWRDEDERTATVSLRLHTEGFEGSNEGDIRTGLPAIVVFTRRGENSFYAGFERSL